MKWFLDTNVLVAACVAEHEHHARALPLMESVHQARAEGFVSAHSLLETFSILTRLPRSPRISPSQAATLFQENVVNHFTLVALTAKESKAAALPTELPTHSIPEPSYLSNSSAICTAFKAAPFNN